MVSLMATGLLPIQSRITETDKLELNLFGFIGITTQVFKIYSQQINSNTANPKLIDHYPYGTRVQIVEVLSGSTIG